MDNLQKCFQIYRQDPELGILTAMSDGLLYELVQHTYFIGSKETVGHSLLDLRFYVTPDIVIHGEDDYVEPEEIEEFDEDQEPIYVFQIYAIIGVNIVNSETGHYSHIHKRITELIDEDAQTCHDAFINQTIQFILNKYDALDLILD
jgi:hypothetical protein